MYIAAETFKQGEITHTVGEVVHNPTNEMLEKGQVIRDSSIPKQAPITPKKVVEVVEPVLGVANTETTETTEATEEILLIEDSADVSIEISDTVQIGTTGTTEL